LLTLAAVVPATESPTEEVLVPISPVSRKGWPHSLTTPALTADWILDAVSSSELACGLAVDVDAAKPTRIIGCARFVVEVHA
jgi:hypothetical protein